MWAQLAWAFSCLLVFLGVAAACATLSLAMATLLMRDMLDLVSKSWTVAAKIAAIAEKDVPQERRP